MSSDAVEPPSSTAACKEFKVLYLFAGRKRETGIPEILDKLAAASKERVAISVEAYDVLRDPAHDLLVDPLRTKILDRLKQGEFDAVIMSPPCGTWSRAPWANANGPRPLRSSQHPWGYPWLEGDKLKKINDSNQMVELRLQAITICLQQAIPFVLEHPEDLGATTRYGPSATSGGSRRQVLPQRQLQHILQPWTNGWLKPFSPPF